jgi:hypothetical protein
MAMEILPAARTRRESMYMCDYFQIQMPCG